MKKDDFKKSIDNINSDTYMGSRLKTKIATINIPVKRNRQIALSIIAFCLAFAIIFGAGFLALKQNDNIIQPSINEDTTSQSKQINAFIMVANAAKSDNAEITTIYKTLELNEEYPYEIYLNVKDISGLSEDELTKLIQETSDNIFNEHCSDNILERGRAQVCTTEKIILSQCGVNEFKLNLDNTENIKTINVKNTSKYGQVVFSTGTATFDAPTHGSNITISGEEFDFEKSGFYWDHTEEMEKAFDKNINTPFSTFNDTITFTVEYTDNSKAIGVIELVFNDFGNGTAICKSYDYMS